MSSILLLTSSPRPQSLSTQVAHELVDHLREHDPSAHIVQRDLVADPLPHVDRGFAVGHRKPAEALDAVEIAALHLSDTLIDEVLAADTLVISTAFINFNITSNLKAWLDYVVRVGKTFRYTPNGPEGLIKNKKAFVVIASGGVYSEGPIAARDHATPYLKWVLQFIGITDVEFVRVEGVSRGPDGPANAVAAARAEISRLAA